MTDQPLPAADPSFRIKVVCVAGEKLSVMFEPSGMIYDLGSDDLESDDVMFADVPVRISNEVEIVKWNGGMSIWAPGNCVTRDAKGNELHRLN